MYKNNQGKQYSILVLLDLKLYLYTVISSAVCKHLKINRNIYWVSNSIFFFFFFFFCPHVVLLHVISSNKMQFSKTLCMHLSLGDEIPRAGTDNERLSDFLASIQRFTFHINMTWKLYSDLHSCNSVKVHQSYFLFLVEWRSYCIIFGTICPRCIKYHIMPLWKWYCEEIGTAAGNVPC